MEVNVWEIIGVVLTVLTMFGALTLFFSNHNAKLVSLEINQKETQEDVAEIVGGSAKRDEKIAELCTAITEMKTTEKGTFEKLTAIDLKLIQTDAKYSAFMEQLSVLNASMVGMNENIKYIKVKFDLQDKIILGEFLKKNE